MRRIQFILSHPAIPALLTIGWMGLIYLLSDQSQPPRMPGWTSSLFPVIGHFAGYAVLATLLWWALRPFELTDRRRFVLAFAGAVIYGIADEWHQSFVPGRDPSVSDVVVDGLGALTALMNIRVFTRPHRGTQPGSPPP